MGTLFRDKVKDKPTEPHERLGDHLADEVRSPCPLCGRTTGCDGHCHDVLPEQVLAQGVVPPDAPEPVAELPEEKPKRRARVIKAKVEDKPSTPEAVEDQKWDIVLRPSGQAEEHLPLILCINASPTQGEVNLLSRVLQPIVQDLSAQLGVTHYRLAKEAEYGRADALLLSAFKEAAPKLTGYVYADKRDADSAAVLGYLEAQAVEVFRGAY